MPVAPVSPLASPPVRDRTRAWTRGSTGATELDAGRLERLPGHQRGQHLRGHPAHLGERLPHRGQRRRGPAGHRQVVEPDDAEVARHIEAGDPSRLDDAEGLLVAAGEDGGRRVGEREQVSGALVPADVVEVAVPDQLGVDRDTGGVESRAVAVDPGPAAEQVLGTADHGDPAVSLFLQVSGRGEPARPVGRAHAGDLGVGQVLVGPARATQRRRAGGTMHVTGHPRPGRCT